MHFSDRLYLSKLSLNTDQDFLFDDDGIQDFDYDGEMNPFLDGEGFDENDYYWDEDLPKRTSGRTYQ